MTVSKCCLIKLLPYILFEKYIFIFWHWKRQAISTVPVVSAHFRSLYRPSYVRRSDCWDACFRPHRMHRVDAACLYTCRSFRCPCVCVCVVLSVCVCWAHRWALRNRLNRSRCRFGKDSCGPCKDELFIGWWCTLAPSGEYDYMIRARRRWGLVSSYFDHLSVLFLLCVSV